ncbi:TolC family protein [Rhabdobacter roseus]|uniref:Outer membrane protein TolC n=1 Tax=Rhabdobacter roseus TaxID=1655419 RepID=A0A840TK09_9BACT|nr:TolC family protein [Rhabdobacter roseus]MBB5283754.1 outer membrane protein TolC [Rhabdobacter roseus]
MKKSILILGAALLTLPFSVTAQTTPWSLKACIEFGLKNNLNVRIAKNQEEIAHQQAREALSGYLPQANGSASVDNNLKLQSTVLPAGIFGPDPTVVTLGTQYQSNVSAQVDQVVYDQALLTGLKANRPNTEKSLLNTVKTKESIIYEISSNYYQVLISAQQISLLQDNLDRTQRLLDILKLQFDNGVIKKVDVDRTQVSINNAQSQLTLAESNLNLAKNRLKYQMGYPIERAIEVSDSLVLKKELATAAMGQFDYNNLTDYKIQRTNLELYGIERDRIKAGYLPKLSVYGRYGALALGNELGQSWKNWFDYGTVGVKLSIPIFDGFRRDAQWKQSVLNLRTQEDQLNLTLQGYALQNSNAEVQLQRALANIGNDERNVELAKEVFDVNTLQYREGTLSLADLLNAENSYKEAQTNYINSLLNYYQARLDLEQSNGTLTDYFAQLSN